MVLQLPQSVSLLDDLGLSHQKVELLEVAVGRIVPPGLLDHDGGHPWASGTLVLLLWVLDYCQHLPLVSDRRDQLVLSVAVLVQLGKVQDGAGGDLGVLNYELAQESFKLSDELRYCAPFRDVLTFESLELLRVLLHDALFNNELGIVAQELLRLSDLVYAVHVFEFLPLLVEDVAFHLIVDRNLVPRSLRSILSRPPGRLARPPPSPQPGVVRLAHVKALHR